MTPSFSFGSKTGTSAARRNSRRRPYEMRLNQDLSQVSEGICFAFSPPAIPGIGAAGGVNFVLEDRSGTGGDFFADNLDRFVAAAQQRPELARVIATYAAHVPQIYVDVDREKVMRQTG